MKLFQRLFGVKAAGRVTHENPLLIESPRIGFLNLIGSKADLLVEEDKRALGGLFSSVETSDSEPPSCDVLMIYCDIQNDGTIVGNSAGLRDIIHAARAPIVIVASKNDGPAYIAAGKKDERVFANLVMTLDRKGAVFTAFLAKLFQQMFSGRSMPMAWVELAPQNPGRMHDECPDTIFIPEVSHIVFTGAT
jgi:hypothetical protein